MPKLVGVDDWNNDVDSIRAVLREPIHKRLIAVIALEYRLLGLALVRGLAKHSPLGGLRHATQLTAAKEFQPAARSIQACDRQRGRRANPIGLPHWFASARYRGDRLHPKQGARAWI